MKGKRIVAISIFMIMVLILSACSIVNKASIRTKDTSEIISSVDSAVSQSSNGSDSADSSEGSTTNDMSEPSSQFIGQIYLYGEAHGVKKILEKEFDLWKDYYQNQGMRHLFVELPYYTAEYMNLWLQSDNDDILEELFLDTAGTAGNTPESKEFYLKIKEQCPETIFHGTDVGHQYDSTGERYLRYLESSGLEESEQYVLTKEVIEQGKYYYQHSDDIYRENMMVENFIREINQLSNENVMGIYGAAHTGLDAMDFSNSIPCMANQLEKQYSGHIVSEDLSYVAKEIDPLRVDKIQVNGKEYEALYYGKQDLSPYFEEYSYREFWRLENAYEDFKDQPLTHNVLPYNDYPMVINTEQIFVIDYTKRDGSVTREYHRADGYIWNGMPTTQEFTVEDMDSDVMSKSILMPLPPLSYYISDHAISKQNHSIKLNLKSSEPNEIVDEEEWFLENDLSMNTFEVPNPFVNTPGKLPEKINEKWNDLIITKAFYDDSYIYCTYGYDFGEGYILEIYDADSYKIEYSLDFSNYACNHEYTESDNGAMYQKVNWAIIKDNILYLSHSHYFSAETTEYRNAYITAIDLVDFSILWRTAPLVCNSYNFLIVDDVIICGYGFTAEPDFLYQVDINTGVVIDTILLKTAPYYFMQKDNVLYVRTYDTNYEFEMVQ